MKYFLFLTLYSFIQAPQPPKFKELFNGKNLSGWSVIHGEANYKVEDGFLVVTSNYCTLISSLATINFYKYFFGLVEVYISELF